MCKEDNRVFIRTYIMYNREKQKNGDHNGNNIW